MFVGVSLVKVGVCMMIFGIFEFVDGKYVVICFD